MNQHGSVARIFAMLLALVLIVPLTPLASAAEQASLKGTLFAAGGEDVLEGAVLHAGNLRTGDIYSSEITGPDGEFEISELPPAAYELAIERDGGLYVAGSQVEIGPGQQRKVNLALKDDDDEGAAPAPGSAAKASKKGIWDKPGLATLIVVGGAFAVGALISELDDSSSGLASPFGGN